MAKDPNQVAADWASRLAASGDKIKRGIDAVTTAPGALAARQADTWANNTMSAKSKFARNVGAVTLDAWRTATETKGIPRIATGAQAAQPKMAAFMTSFLPFVASAKASLSPRGTYEQNKARAVAMMDKIHGYRKQ
jgi:hypothetical protein